jgi:hypothetical protein
MKQKQGHKFRLMPALLRAKIPRKLGTSVLILYDKYNWSLPAATPPRVWSSSELTTLIPQTSRQEAATTVKVKCTLEQATKAQKRSRDIVLLFL